MFFYNFLTRRPLLLSIDYSGTWYSIQYYFLRIENLTHMRMIRCFPSPPANLSNSMGPGGRWIRTTDLPGENKRDRPSDHSALHRSTISTPLLLNNIRYIPILKCCLLSSIHKSKAIKTLEWHSSSLTSSVFPWILRALPTQ
jgi:hypothetical protein